MRAIIEFSGVIVVTAAAILVFAVVLDGPRAGLFLEDGDSLVLALAAASRAQGLPQDWVMSTVGFFPEAAIHRGLSTLGLSLRATLALNGVVNVLLAYGALRVVAAVALPHGSRWRLPGALGATGVVLALSLTETSADRDSAEIVSLVFTTTYYGATVIAMILLVALVARGGRRAGRRTTALVSGAIVVVVSVSTVSNALILPWACAPLLLIVGVTRLPDALRVARSVVRTRSLAPAALVGRSAAAWTSASLAVGAGLGLIVRRSLSSSFGGSVGGITASDRSGFPSLGATWAERVGAPGGIVTTVVLGTAIVLSGLATVLAYHRRDHVMGLVAAFGWVAPLTTVAGLLLLDVPYPRYLQPVVWAPVIALCVFPVLVEAIAHRLAPRPSPRPGGSRHGVARLGLRLAAAVVVVAMGTAGARAAPTVLERAEGVRSDLRCAAHWIEGSGRRGVAGFWTARALKLDLADQRSLVQVDDRLRAKAWMVNRHDFDGLEAASFIVLGRESEHIAPRLLPTADPARIRCGTIVILDYGRPIVPVDTSTVRHPSR